MGGEMFTFRQSRVNHRMEEDSYRIYTNKRLTEYAKNKPWWGRDGKE